MSEHKAGDLVEVGGYKMCVVSNTASTRDHFAALAMAAIISKLPLMDADGELGEATTRGDNLKLYNDVAESAYYYADAMVTKAAQTFR
jgi:hypothetical protein